MNPKQPELKLNVFAQYIANWRSDWEFYTPANIEHLDRRDYMLGKLMLVVTEIAEAAEAVRHADVANFNEEIADTFIRLMDICGTMQVDIEKVIKDKMEANYLRPKRHGKHCSL